MSREPDWLFRDILDACADIDAFLQGVDRVALESDRLRQKALITCIIVVGEASARLPQSEREKMPGVPWGKIIGMRNILDHMYYNIDLDILWDACVRDIPVIREAVQSRIES